MEDMREQISREPPEGFLEWAARELAGDLDTFGFLYEQEWAEDWGLEQLLDEWAKPRKRRMVRVECSCCGYRDLYHYGRDYKAGYGFVLPESYTEVEGGTIYGDGENILCPQCGTPVLIRKRADVRKKGYFVTSEARAMSASLVGKDRLLAITCWVIQRQAGIGGGSRLAAIPAEAYVFSPTECAQLMGWVNGYRGAGGYFIQYTRAWRQPKGWRERTHAPADSPEVQAGLLEPWRSAAEIIDWSLPCPSIFDTKEEIRARYGLAAQRPLKPNTLRRVARGVDKFVIKSANPFLVVVNHAGEFRGQEIGDPLQTITAKHGYGVASPAMVPWTVTNTTNSTGHPVNEPIDTARTGGGGGQMFLGASMIQYHTEQSEHVRGQKITKPIMTIDAANRYGLTAATLVKYYGTDQHGQKIQDPLHTVTAKARGALMATHLVKMKGTNLGGPMSEPVQTITAGGGHFGVVTTVVVKAEPGANLKHWPEIRDLLNTYCGYHLGPEDVILFEIGGVAYFMADIGLRMMIPRELYAANGFPPDYIIDRDYLGNAYGKSKQVARCGNAVPPPFATALVRANLPEWCGGVDVSTMAELERMVAV